MTGPGAANASRMRIAGIVLLAVAGVAAVIGLVALGGQGGPSSTSAAPAPSTSPTPLPGAGPPGQLGAGQPGQPGVAPPGALGPGSAPQPGGPGGPGAPPIAAAPIVPPAEGAVVGGQPGAATGGPTGGSGGGAGAGAGVGGGAAGGSAGGSGVNYGVPVRVFNNSTIRGLADRAAGEMRGNGWNVVEVGNYADGIIPVSTVYYRPGTDEQGAAEAAAGQFGIRAEPRFPGIAQASPGVIVIATNNWGTNKR